MTSVRFSTPVLTTVVLLAAPTPAQHAGTAPAEYQARLYLFHGTGHPLGLQTHDVYDRARPYEAGMVFTTEPGVYVRKDDILDSAIFNALAAAELSSMRAAFTRDDGIGSGSKAMC